MNIAFACSPDGGADRGAAFHVVVPDAPRVSEFLAPSAAGARPNKRKRRPAGTPDPDAEVVALSPKTLMESDRYVCEICNQGFQRDQNLQMHRRRHKVPWKLLKRPNLATTKRVYICPERSCLHHDPAHALGDLVGIKKHYRRKHCTEKQWKCDKCSKGYAVQSDYKAHLKTCGTRGHCCDCGRVFSRVESFIEHQDTCCAVKRKATQSGPIGTGISSPSQSSDTTQAMSLTHSGISDTAAVRSADTNWRNTPEGYKALLEEHARRVQAGSPAATPSSSAMPAWLADHSRRNELALLQQLPTHASGVRPATRVDHHGSRSQVTRCSSNSAVAFSCPETTTIVEPSLQLSIGLAPAEIATSSPSSCTDIKPSFRSSTALTLTNYQDPKPIVSSRPAPAGFGALAHNMVPALVGEPGPNRDQRVSVSGFLGALSPAESSAAGLVHPSTKSKHETESRAADMALSYYNSASTSGHENRTGNVHASDQALGTRATTRGFPNIDSPATSSAITSRQAQLHLGVAQYETDHLFGAKSHVSDDLVFRLTKQPDAAARVTTDQGCNQKRADMNEAWSDLSTRARRVGEIRQECDEARRELARAEMLKREAREQLQFAAAEKAYAERAREAAKRQVEISEAELVKAKRLRAHAQAELQKAGPVTFSTTLLCPSCKSAIESCPPSIRSTSTDQLEAGFGQIVMNPGHRSESIPAGFDNSGRLWPAYGHRTRSTGKSPPSGGGFDPAAVHVSSPEHSHRRDQIAPQDLDLN